MCEKMLIRKLFYKTCLKNVNLRKDHLFDFQVGSSNISLLDFWKTVLRMKTVELFFGVVNQLRFDLELKTEILIS